MNDFRIRKDGWTFGQTNHEFRENFASKIINTRKERSKILTS